MFHQMSTMKTLWKTVKARTTTTPPKAPNQMGGELGDPRSTSTVAIPDTDGHPIETNATYGSKEQKPERRHGRDPLHPAQCEVEQGVTPDILHPSPGVPRENPGSVEQSGVFAGLSSRRSRVQIPSFPLTEIDRSRLRGQVAQLVERRSEKPEVDGSTPSLTTTTQYEDGPDSKSGPSSRIKNHGVKDS